MSPKELLYIEDVLGHEEQLKASCADFAQKLEDAELRDFVENLSRQHAECFTRFYGLLK